MGKLSLVKSTTKGKKAEVPDGEFMMMELARLRPNQWNTKSPARYSGPDFDDLVASIEAKGLIQPIVVRPVDKNILKDDTDHEIVCGERRYRAKLAIAEKNGGPHKNTIAAIVRSLSDDEAFDVSGVLQMRPTAELDGVLTPLLVCRVL